MGRSRRRHKHGSFIPKMEQLEERAPSSFPVITTLAPTYVPVTPSPWAAESDMPELELEGIEPADAIRAPAILVDDDPGPSVALLADSSDPEQLDLTVVVEDEFAPGVIDALAPVVDPIEERFQEGRAALEEGRVLDARAILRDVIAQRPSHLAARNALGLLLERQGDGQAALGEYDRALEIDADHATLLTNRGALLGAMGRYAAAERDLKKVLRADPAHIESLFHLGVVFTRKGLWGEAVAQLRRVVELDPARGQAYFYLGEALNKIDDLYGAMAAYQRSAELIPDHARALYGLGIVYDRLGRPDDAARMYRRSRETGRR